MKSLDKHRKHRAARDAGERPDARKGQCERRQQQMRERASRQLGPVAGEEPYPGA